MKIGIDMGGTNLRAALVNKHGIVRMEQVASPAHGTEQEAIDVLCKLVERLLSDGIDGIGAGIPSVIDRDNGIVYNAANIPSWKEVHLKDILHKRFGMKIAIENDSNCFTLGVARYGDGQRFGNFVGTTLGTGLGGGIIINHQLYGGVNGGAGEIGSLPYLDSDLEHYCSSMFFEHGQHGEGCDVRLRPRSHNNRRRHIASLCALRAFHARHRGDVSLSQIGGTVTHPAFDIEGRRIARSGKPRVVQ